ncbi:hypothetical protein FPQ18DRAFT_305310 [Pyronema domesticum]|nr:hypothetical protein FPQ18DRAFT_305310 [Pyronema domesticum]
MRWTTVGASLLLWGVQLVVADSDPCAEFAQTRGNAVTGLDAKLWLRCIQNIPFRQSKAAETIRNLKIFFGLDTYAQYMINPPTTELELTPFKLNETIAEIENNIRDMKYRNNWEFDYDVVKMFQRFRDGHTDYQPVCTHGYLYVHDFPITAISKDSSSLPDIYHVLADFESSIWRPPRLGQKIIKINGQDPHTYLSDFTRNSPEALDWVDPDARFNEMLYGYPEGTSRGRFARRNMWNGEDIKIIWENGTETTVEFKMQLAKEIFQNGKLLFKDTKSLEEICFLSDMELALRKRGVVSQVAPGRIKKRGERGDFKERAKHNGREDEMRDLQKRRDIGNKKRAALPLPKVPNGYPQPLSYSDEYAMATYPVPGDPETVVLNIRTFDETYLSSSAFVQSMTRFIRSSIVAWKSAGYQRLIIDVSNNRGGKAILPFDILKQLFPADEEFMTINMHYSPLTWAYMSTINSGREYSLFKDTSMNDFSSMTDFLGPVQKDGTCFTKMWKQDYVQFGKDAYDIIVSASGPPPFKPENIAVISNSLCASACHSLVESLRAQGVRAFAYGGRAVKSSPMQPVGGTKGGKVLRYEDVRQHLLSAQPSLVSLAGPKEDWQLSPLPVRTTQGNTHLMLNSENKFRAGNSLPLQFVYTPACGRFWMEEKMLSDVSEVWRRTREMAWDEQGVAKRCVEYKQIDDQRKYQGGREDEEGVVSGAWSTGRIVYETFRGR